MSNLKTLLLLFSLFLSLPSLATECFEELLEFHKPSVRERLIELKNRQIENMSSAPVYADDFRPNQIYKGKHDRRFKIVRKLGEGQEGAAYLVTHQGRRYVLKDFFKAYKFSKYDYELGREKILDRLSLAEPSEHDEDISPIIAKYREFLESNNQKLSKFLNRSEISELKDFMEEQAQAMAKMNLNGLQGLKNDGHRTVDVFSDESHNGVLILEYIDGLSVKEILEDRDMAKELNIKRRFDDLFESVSASEEQSILDDIDSYRDPLNNFDDFEDFPDFDDNPFENIYDVSIGFGNSGAHLIPDNVFYDFKTGELVIIDPS